MWNMNPCSSSTISFSSLMSSSCTSRIHSSEFWGRITSSKSLGTNSGSTILWRYNCVLVNRVYVWLLKSFECSITYFTGWVIFYWPHFLHNTEYMCAIVEILRDTQKEVMNNQIEIINQLKRVKIFKKYSSGISQRVCWMFST